MASHNLSGAAWGRLERNGSQLYIMSYEVRVGEGRGGAEGAGRVT